MDGTSLYVNLKTGPGGVGLPPGNQVGDIMQWNGVEWVPRQINTIVGGLVDPVMLFQDVQEEDVPVIIIPAGKKLISINFAARPGADIAQLSGSTSPSGYDVFQSHAIAGRNPIYNPEGLTCIEINKVFSLTTDTRIYLNDSGDGDYWNAMIMNIYIILKSLL